MHVEAEAHEMQEEVRGAGDDSCKGDGAVVNVVEAGPKVEEGHYAPRSPPHMVVPSFRVEISGFSTGQS